MLAKVTAKIVLIFGTDPWKWSIYGILNGYPADQYVAKTVDSLAVKLSGKLPTGAQMSTEQIDDQRQYEYRSSHPWIAFTLNLKAAKPSLWIDLGEAASKCEHIAGAALAPETSRELLTLYMAKGANATTAIEGNTLTESQVLALLNHELHLPRSQEYLAKEVENVIDAANKIIKDMVSGKDSSLSVEKIKLYNKMVLKGLPVENHVVPGEIRTCSVTAGARYRGAPWQDCEYLLQRFCEWMNSAAFQDDRLPPTVLGILKAIVAHIYIAWIHPFGDGNGRTARLLELQILLEARVPVPACQLLSNHYNQTRHLYYTRLDEISRNGGDILPFIDYALQGYVEQLCSQIAIIQDFQLRLAWQAYVDTLFTDKTTITGHRQRELLMELPDTPISTHQVGELSITLARMYASRTDRAVARDLKALETMGVVEFLDGGKSVRAKREIIKAFIPDRRSVRLPKNKRPK